jgi:hypothetical protein
MSAQGTYVIEGHARDSELALCGSVHTTDHDGAVRHEASLRAHGLVGEGFITNGLRYAIALWERQ